MRIFSKMIFLFTVTTLSIQNDGNVIALNGTVNFLKVFPKNKFFFHEKERFDLSLV